MKGYIYMLLCKSNDRLYIGYTTRDFRNRKNEHINLLKRNEHKNTELQNDFNLYGECVFEIYPLECIEYQYVSELKEREDVWIEFYKQNHNRSVYNIRKSVAIVEVNEWHGNREHPIEYYAKIKSMIDEGYKNKDIVKELNASKTVVSYIRNGRHWSLQYIN